MKESENTASPCRLQFKPNRAAENSHRSQSHRSKVKFSHFFPLSLKTVFSFVFLTFSCSLHWLYGFKSFFLLISSDVMNLISSQVCRSVGDLSSLLELWGTLKSEETQQPCRFIFYSVFCSSCCAPLHHIPPSASCLPINTFLPFQWVNETFIASEGIFYERWLLEKQMKLKVEEYRVQSLRRETTVILWIYCKNCFV